MLENDELALFREAIKGTKKIKQDTFVPKVEPRKKINEIRELKEKADTLFYFSDEYEPLLTEENDKVKYRREDVDPYILKQLRRGDFHPELFLDLHGLTKENAKKELASLILACEREGIYCASIMTGYGTRALKYQIPRWLLQHPKVIALHQAPREWGGNSAILILIEQPEKLDKKR
ncbi:endonuclease SmrB [Glaesserella parasuis]|uniref:Ribosome rescue factor SmrB n=1 Tax=Glaesserella parasuis TaxID=738 RepID=A0A859IGX8_GLAPU|nr:endonuclease SmrB [Glaesserella parasuis]MDG6480694.1 endonuclease SmrB [Glaesserella parasuis]MWQ20999.1 endonuclease SmrB [Glaesserella parasuis]MWQ64274.1 endonuclease SmrB [Glaesserella parasuis]MWQ79516.1 endonuclease SmrB [Glaesserella parasuis]QKY73226.1 endonuclease SmrB [Glaesserella parasuis]